MLKYGVFLILLAFMGCTGSSSNERQETPVPPVEPNNLSLILTKNLDGGTLEGSTLCGANCLTQTLQKPVGSMITLTVTPKAGYYVESWSIPSCGNNLSCSFVLLSDTEIAISFGVYDIIESDYSVTYDLSFNKQLTPPSNPLDYTLVNTQTRRYTTFLSENAQEIHFYSDASCQTEKLIVQLDAEGFYFKIEAGNYYSEELSLSNFYKYKNTTTNKWSQCYQKPYQSTYQPLGYRKITQDYTSNQNSGVITQFKEFNGDLYVLMQYLPLSNQKLNWLYKFNDATNSLDPVTFEGEPLVVFNIPGLFVQSDKMHFVVNKVSSLTTSRLFSILSNGTVKKQTDVTDDYTQVQLSQYGTRLFLSYKDTASTSENKNYLYSITASPTVDYINKIGRGRYVSSLKFFNEGIYKDSYIYFPNEWVNGIRNGVLRVNDLFGNDLKLVIPYKDTLVTNGTYQFTFKFANTIYSFFDTSIYYRNFSSLLYRFFGETAEEITFEDMTFVRNFNLVIINNALKVSENSLVGCDTMFIGDCKYYWKDESGEHILKINDYAASKPGQMLFGTSYNKDGQIIVSGTRKQINAETKEVRPNSSTTISRIFNKAIAYSRRETVDGVENTYYDYNFSINEMKAIYKNDLYAIQGIGVYMTRPNEGTHGFDEGLSAGLVKTDSDNNRHIIDYFCGTTQDNNNINLYSFKGRLIFNTIPCDGSDKQKLNIYQEN